MNKIKIVGVLVFILSLILALISMDIADKNRENIANLSFFSEQKSLIQEVSKTIFYSYKNGINASKDLLLFDINVSNSKIITPKIKSLWRNFYIDVKKFKKQQRVITTYNSIITAKLVNSIYHKNVLLTNAFNRLILAKKTEITQQIEAYKKLQNRLFFILIILLFYLFTQLHLVVNFIDKFSKISKNILKKSTIQGVELIEIKTTTQELQEVTNNYNQMVQKMNSSIGNASQSMDKSIKSLEEVAQNIENFMELLSTMNPDASDDFFKKEDAVIDSLDTLMHLRKKLKSLKLELEKLNLF